MRELTDDCFTERRAFEAAVLVSAGVLGVGLEDLGFERSGHFVQGVREWMFQIECDTKKLMMRLNSCIESIKMTVMREGQDYL